LIGNILFLFQNGADQNEFDVNLPITEHMLNSTQLI
jgi:hypothetical protein